MVESLREDTGSGLSFLQAQKELGWSLSQLCPVGAGLEDGSIGHMKFQFC